MDSKYKFDPLKHGFEPITNYPELDYNFPMIDKYFIKVVAYQKDDNGKLRAYWYEVLNFLGHDERIEIKSGLLDFDKPLEYNFQSNPRTVYQGLISNDTFARELLEHLLGTTMNESVKTTGKERYEADISEEIKALKN